MGNPGDKAAEMLVAAALKSHEEVLDRARATTREIDEKLARYAPAQDGPPCSRADWEAGYREGLRTAGWLDELVERKHLDPQRAEVIELVKLDGTAKRWRRVEGRPYRAEPPRVEQGAVPIKRSRWATIGAVASLAMGLATIAEGSTQSHLSGFLASSIAVAISLFATWMFLTMPR